MDFACASGALGLTGDGWWWEQPFRWLGYLDPKQFTIITKTLTLNPLGGNLKMWKPWEAVRVISGGAINAVGLTNPGIDWWIANSYAHTVKRDYKIIVSIYPQNAVEAERMIAKLEFCKNIVGIQINLSCPNIAFKMHEDIKILHNIKILNAALQSSHPVAVKLSYQEPYLRMCETFDSMGLAFIELINTVPYNLVFPTKKSPLSKYGYEGGVSGNPIRDFAREALAKVKWAGIKTPIASGGGISSAAEVYARAVLGAKAFVMGTVFLKSITKPNRIVAECRKSFA
jgi:dihydroorotate dehydrogenase (NAD+) catalytic subunit